jgi:TATA-binding protein-associated factor Taf7
MLGLDRNPDFYGDKGFCPPLYQIRRIKMWFFTDRKQAEKKIREIEKSKSNVIHLGTDHQSEQIVKNIENKIKKAASEKSWF